jgi:hypothetical protein
VLSIQLAGFSSLLVLYCFWMDWHDRIDCRVGVMIIKFSKDE